MNDIVSCHHFRTSSFRSSPHNFFVINWFYWPPLFLFLFLSLIRHPLSVLPDFGKRKSRQHTLLQVFTKLFRFVYNSSGATGRRFIHRATATRIIGQRAKFGNFRIFWSGRTLYIVIGLGIIKNQRRRYHRKCHGKYQRFDTFHPGRITEATNLFVPASRRPCHTESDIQ